MRAEECEKALSELGTATGGVQRPWSKWSQLGSGLDAVAKQIQVAHDNGQDIVEIMGDPTGQLANRFHLHGLAQLRFKRLPLGNVVLRTRYDDAFVGFQRAEAYLDRKFRSVLAQAIKLESYAHGASLGIREEAVSVGWLLLPESQGQQQLDLLADHFGSGVAEKLLGLGRDDQDLSGAVRNDDRVGSCFEQPFELFLGLPALRDFASQRC